jgi:hypothetical protein
VGVELAASKNREVDKILGSHASDEGGGSMTFKASALSEASATLDDRSKVWGGTGGTATCAGWMGGPLLVVQCCCVCWRDECTGVLEVCR